MAALPIDNPSALFAHVAAPGRVTQQQSKLAGYGGLIYLIVPAQVDGGSGFLKPFCDSGLVIGENYQKRRQSHEG